MEFESPFFPMPITRSRVMLEAASELVGMKLWRYRQARISLRDQEEGEWRISLFGSDNIEAIEAVDRGEVHIATLNPAAPLSLAYRGCGPSQFARLLSSRHSTSLLLLLRRKRVCSSCLMWLSAVTPLESLCVAKRPIPFILC